MNPKVTFKFNIDDGFMDNIEFAQSASALLNDQ